jgi:hypothetical protein
MCVFSCMQTASLPISLTVEQYLVKTKFLSSSGHHILQISLHVMCGSSRDSKLGWKILVLCQYKTSEIMWQRSHSCTRRGLEYMLPTMTGMTGQACKCRMAVLQGWLSTTHYAWVLVTLILLQIFRIEGCVASGLNPSSAVPRSSRFYMLWKLDLSRDLLSWFLAMAVSNHMYLRMRRVYFTQVISGVFYGHEKALRQMSLPTEFCLFSFFLSFLYVCVCVCVCSSEFCIVAWFGSVPHNLIYFVLEIIQMLYMILVYLNTNEGMEF